MFKKKLQASQAQVLALTALIANAGFSVEELTAEGATPDALKDAIAANSPQSVVEADVIKGIFGESLDNHDPAAATAYLGELEKSAESADSHEATAEALQTGLTAAGIKVEAAEGATLTAVEVTTAVQTHVTAASQTRAVEILAEAGHDAADLVPASSEAKSAEGLVGRDRLDAAAAEAHPELFKKN